MIVAVTGHRPERLGGYGVAAKLKLERFARQVLEHERSNEIITGMALGWDQAIAQSCVKLDIPFIAAIPFTGQKSAWPSTSQVEYRWLLSKAAYVYECSPPPFTPEKMQVRNQWMVDHAEKVIALWNGTSGGTANCVRYAERMKVPLVNVWDEWKEAA